MHEEQLQADVLKTTSLFMRLCPPPLKKSRFDQTALAGLGTRRTGSACQGPHSPQHEAGLHGGLRLCHRAVRLFHHPEGREEACGGVHAGHDVCGSEYPLLLTPGFSWYQESRVLMCCCIPCCTRMLLNVAPYNIDTRTTYTLMLVTPPERFQALQEQGQYGLLQTEPPSLHFL